MPVPSPRKWPRTYAELCVRFKPVGNRDWRNRLGTNAPPRVVGYLEAKGAK